MTSDDHVIARILLNPISVSNLEWSTQVDGYFDKYTISAADLDSVYVFVYRKGSEPWNKFV